MIQHKTQYNQTLVDAVLATGGNNTHRILVVQGYRLDGQKADAHHLSPGIYIRKGQKFIVN